MSGRTTSQAFEAFIDRWTEERQEAENVFNDKKSAHLIGVFLEELRAMRMAELAVELTVHEAAAVSGYDPSSIWRMLADGNLEAVDDAEDTRILATALPLRIDRKQTMTEPEQPDTDPSEATNHSLGAARLEPVDD